MAEKKRDIKIKNIGGRDYAYDMISYWDKDAKKYRKKSIYLGVVTDKKTKAYTPKADMKVISTENELIKSFGDSYSIAKAIEISGFDTILKTILPKDYDTLISLICHKLLKSSSMQYVEKWAEGNIVSTLYKNADLSSQRISDFLKKLGSEHLLRKFFKLYIEKIAGNKAGIIIDSTGLPNEINFPLSAWGNHGGECERETRLLMVVDKISGMPLYFRYMAGNIVDVSTLANTIAELKEMGVNTTFSLIDAGYFSEDNIKELYLNNISFVTRLPSGRKLYKRLIVENSDIEKAENLVVYGKRALYVKRVEIDLFGNKGFAYVICDVKRKGDETNKFLIAAIEDSVNNDDINNSLNEKGKFIIISSDEIPVNEIIPLYYTRQSAENLFGISKSFLDILPLRVHSIETFRGYLMLTFISLVVYLEIKKSLGEKFTVEGALTEMGNLMSKIYGNTAIICEPTKRMKLIAERLGFMVPNKLGV